MFLLDNFANSQGIVYLYCRVFWDINPPYHCQEVRGFVHPQDCHLVTTNVDGETVNNFKDNGVELPTVAVSSVCMNLRCTECLIGCIVEISVDDLVIDKEQYEVLHHFLLY